MIIDALCGRTAELPADPGRAGALAALMVRELAHRIFLDDADVRIADFVHRLHRQTGADPHLLDAVLRGLLGAPLPAVADPLTPLLVLGRGLVLALELDDQAVAELAARFEQRLPDRLPTSVAPPNPQAPSVAIPAMSPTLQPPVEATSAADPRPVPSTTPVAPRSAKALYIVAGMVATFGVFTLFAGLLVLLGTGGDDVGSDDTTAPPNGDPSRVIHAFAEAINSRRFDRASTLLCGESSSMTRHVARGQLQVKGFTVDSVETRNSTTAYLLAKATIGSQSEPLVWRGTLRTRGGSWCVLDIHPEDNSPPMQPESRDVALEKMRKFIALVGQGDSAKAMTYACGTHQRTSINTKIGIVIGTRARLTVKPDHGPEGASTYTGDLSGRSRVLGQEISGSVTVSRSDDGTYCISHIEFRYE
ncbi:hypothetical protein [Spirillospora sp. NPDC048819]|uniref:hypothetical protein n=1 Tax=Spirillospora sp. NPDC048819 TaxID=3155268 RepID=UPI0033EC3556